jgi:hypothetical protein
MKSKYCFSLLIITIFSLLFVNCNFTIHLRGEKQIAIVEIGEHTFTYHGQEAFNEGTKSLPSSEFKHIVQEGIDYFIYTPDSGVEPRSYQCRCQSQS